MASGANNSSRRRRRRSLFMDMAGEEELQEEDVWSVLKERETSGPEMKFPRRLLPSSSPWHIPSLPRTVIRERSKEGSGAKQSSAPVNVPDWSKIYGDQKNIMKKKKKKNSHLYDDDDDDGCSTYDGDDVMVPPHEWVARELARTQISSFSMCEGIGRTLKGRDLSKVRNAVLTKTGFLE